MKKITSSVISTTAYPLLIAAAMAIFYLLSAAGFHLIVATYVPVTLAALAIALLERLHPERIDWKPAASELRLDALYMGLVQVLLPRLLTFLVVWGLMDAVGSLDLSIWPGHWPTGLQVMLMLVSGEFFRYWLHRAAHEWPPLWRLHAIHHSPKALYWLNVGRFHPLEKCLQFVIDVLPFLLLGVSEEVVALYFVFFAVNGFFQHCNIRLKFGWLNYLISTAALHRWHHSVEVAESNTNYGNNLIIWDLLFGTWYLPTRQKVQGLGVKNSDVPAGFAGQMLAPFRTSATAGVQS